MYIIQELTNEGFNTVAESISINEAKAIMAALTDFSKMEMEEDGGVTKNMFYIRIVEYTERGALIIEESVGERIESGCLQ